MKQVSIILLFLVFASCEYNDIVKVDNLKPRNLKGHVKSVNTEVWNLQVKDGHVEVGQKINSCYFHQNSIAKFNRYGSLTSEMEFSGRGDTLREVQKDFASDSSIVTKEFYGEGREEVVIARYDTLDSLIAGEIVNSNYKGMITWERDQLNRISKRTMFANGDLISRIIFEYDQKGQVLKEFHYGKDSLPTKTITRIYDRKYIVQETTIDLKNGDSMQFDNRYIHCRMDSSIIAQGDFEEAVTQYQRIAQFYDEDSVLRRSVSTPVGSKRYNIRTQEWDKNRNLIKHKTVDNDKEDVFEVTYTYNYDEVGNWTEMKSFAKGEPVCIVTRKIEYY